MIGTEMGPSFPLHAKKAVSLLELQAVQVLHCDHLAFPDHTHDYETLQFLGSCTELVDPDLSFRDVDPLALGHHVLEEMDHIGMLGGSGHHVAGCDGRSYYDIYPALFQEFHVLKVRNPGYHPYAFGRSQ